MSGRPPTFRSIASHYDTEVSEQKFYVTTAIYYVNDRPGLHHAYEFTGTDALARFHRQRGREVYFLTGSDENATKNAQAAALAGEDTRAFVDRLAAEFKRAQDVYRIRSDRFIRTTDPDHVASVQEFIRRWIANDDVYLSTYDGLYCVGCEAFYEETDLVEGRCEFHPNRVIERLQEENYFFRLTKYEQALKDLYAGQPDFCVPETRRNEVLGWLDRGLRDISISRRNLKWGIPFPDHPEHTVYVWFDALINYVTGVGFPGDPESFAKWWPADLHVIGKDISRFHCLYWPAMLLAAGLPLPKQVYVHGFLEYGGQRLSKGTGNMIDPFLSADEWGVDGIRYLVLRAAPFARDSPVSAEIFDRLFNAELANGIGNTVQRTLAMIEKYFAGVVPEPNEGGATERRVRDAAARALERHDDLAGQLDFSGAIGEIVDLLKAVDRMYTETKPWELAKQPASRAALESVLYTGAEAVRIAGLLLWPYTPGVSETIAERLAQPRPDAEGWAHAARWGALEPGARARPGEGLFPRLGPTRG